MDDYNIFEAPHAIFVMVVVMALCAYRSSIFVQCMYILWDGKC